MHIRDKLAMLEPIFNEEERRLLAVADRHLMENAVKFYCEPRA
jgi:hypothetical protein